MILYGSGVGVWWCGGVLCRIIIMNFVILSLDKACLYGILYKVV